jgi:hypothetical protein
VWVSFSLTRQILAKKEDLLEANERRQIQGFNLKCGAHKNYRNFLRREDSKGSDKQKG